MKFPCSLLALLAGVALLHAAPAKSAADTAFEATAKSCLDDYLRLNPENATQLGDHRFDGELTDYSVDGLKANVATMRRHLAALAQIDPAQLTGPNRVDAQILRLNLEAQVFFMVELKSQDWDPLSYNTSLANALYLLVARDFAPAESRLHRAAQRLAGIPGVIAQAKANLRNPPEIYTQTAIKQVNGAIGLVRDGLEDLLKEAPGMRVELAPLQEKAAAALTEYKQWLEKDLLPRSKGDFRIGADLYRKCLRYTLASDLAPEEILARAEREMETTTAALYATALPLHRKYFPAADAATQADRPKVIKAVLDHLAQEHPDNSTVVAYGRQTLQLATEFVRAHDLVTVPETPVKLIVTPEFKRGRGIAYCDSPGALEPNGDTFVAIEPTPADWPETRMVSFFREYNNYMMRDLLVHEAMPGHFLQLMHNNRYPSRLRAVLSSGAFVEGWAVYAEWLMAHHGFGGARVRIQREKMLLRVAANTVLDHGVHAAGMSEHDALALMQSEAFQEEGEAVGKWKRARLTGAQLSTYFYGFVRMKALRESAEKGGAFSERAFHDRLLSFGSPPPRHLPELMR